MSRGGGGGGPPPRRPSVLRNETPFVETYAQGGSQCWIGAEFSQGAAKAAAAFRTAQAMPGDRFRWACTSGMFRNLEGQPDSTLKTISDYGFPGTRSHPAVGTELRPRKWS